MEKMTTKIGGTSPLDFFLGCGTFFNLQKGGAARKIMSLTDVTDIKRLTSWERIQLLCKLWFWCQVHTTNYGVDASHARWMATHLFQQLCFVVHWWSITHKSPSFWASDVLPTQRTRKNQKTIILDTRFCAHITGNFGLYFKKTAISTGPWSKALSLPHFSTQLEIAWEVAVDFSKKDTNCNGENCWWKMKTWVDAEFIPRFTRLYTSQVQDFFNRIECFCYT